MRALWPVPAAAHVSSRHGAAQSASFRISHRIARACCSDRSQSPRRFAIVGGGKRVPRNAHHLAARSRFSVCRESCFICLLSYMKEDFYCRRDTLASNFLSSLDTERGSPSRLIYLKHAVLRASLEMTLNCVCAKQICATAQQKKAYRMNRPRRAVRIHQPVTGARYRSCAGAWIRRATFAPDSGARE